MASRSKFASRCSLFLLLAAAGALTLLVPIHAHAQNWYVKADALPGGNGSPEFPFSTLAEVESNAQENDIILVIPSALALDGGITLKDGQILLGTCLPDGSGGSPFSCTFDRARITNSTGDGVTLGNNNLVSNLHVENPLRHGILGDGVTGAVVVNNLITGWNRELTQGRAIKLVSRGASATASLLVRNVIVQGPGVGIDLAALETSYAFLFVDGNWISDLNVAEDPRAGPNHGILAVSFDAATIDLVANNNLIDNIGLGSDGLTTAALDSSRINCIVRGLVFRNTLSLGGVFSNGLETFTGPGATTFFRMDYSDIIDSASSGFVVWNLSGKPASDLIDLGGGALGSEGQNRIFNNGLETIPILVQTNVSIGDGDVVAKNNWWGTPAGLDAECPVPASEGSSCSRLFLDSTLLAEPFLFADPRP